jgi:hypothetical protein
VHLSPYIAYVAPTANLGVDPKPVKTLPDQAEETLDDVDNVISNADHPERRAQLRRIIDRGL